jgi:hypothetical protein
MINTEIPSVPNPSVPLKENILRNGRNWSQYPIPPVRIRVNENERRTDGNGGNGRASLPKTAAQFLKAIKPELSDWRMCIEPSEPNDTNPSRTVFWLASDPSRRAIVAYEYNRLIVTIDPARTNYWFELSRLHEHEANRWSWQKQLSEKTWCKPEHIELLDALCRLFPISESRAHG